MYCLCLPGNRASFPLFRLPASIHYIPRPHGACERLVRVLCHNEHDPSRDHHMPVITRTSSSAAPGGPVGVLLSNLGTPDAPTPAALRAYLCEFLSDPKVIDLPHALWWPILHGYILRSRPRHSAAAYARIWSGQGSPLLVHTRAMAAALGREIEVRTGAAVKLALGMRYGRPTLAAALRELAGLERIVVLPLYPQYAEATAGSTVARLKQLTSKPLDCIAGYADQPAYLAALAASVREHWQARGRGERLLISFHGIPQRAVDKGDPYAEQCAHTAQGLAAALHLSEPEWRLVFQSRFGRAQWLQPYTEDTLRQFAAEGVETVDVICPGFAADCLETLEEIALRYAQSFRAAGGRELRYIPALNARPDHIRALADLVCARLPNASHAVQAAG